MDSSLFGWIGGLNQANWFAQGQFNLLWHEEATSAELQQSRPSPAGENLSPTSLPVLFCWSLSKR